MVNHRLVRPLLFSEDVLHFDGSLVKCEFIFGACLLVSETGISLLEESIAVVTDALSVRAV